MSDGAATRDEWDWWTCACMTVNGGLHDSCTYCGYPRPKAKIIPAPEALKPACERCRFYDNGMTAADFDPNCKTGDCRRRAPVSVKWDHGLRSHFPLVKATDWCGEFQQREEV